MLKGSCLNGLLSFFDKETYGGAVKRLKVKLCQAKN